jgi:hypothetical protein
MSNILDTIWDTALSLYQNGLMNREALEEFKKLCEKAEQKNKGE